MMTQLWPAAPPPPPNLAIGPLIPRSPAPRANDRQPPSTPPSGEPAPKPRTEPPSQGHLTGKRLFGYRRACAMAIIPHLDLTQLRGDVTLDHVIPPREAEFAPLPADLR